MSITFEESLAGGLRVHGADRDAPIALVIRARAPGLGALLRCPELPIEGELEAEGIARRQALRGTLRVSSAPEARGLAYAFTFAGDDGARYAFAGKRALVPGARLAALTVLAGELHAEGGPVLGRALLRFDLRSDALRLLRSVRLWPDAAPRTE